MLTVYTALVDLKLVCAILTRFAELLQPRKGWSCLSEPILDVAAGAFIISNKISGD